MHSAIEWRDRIGQIWADHYAATDRVFGGLTQVLLERLASVPGDTICDIGCGAGELSLALASARPHAAILGIDISPDQIAAARVRASGNTKVQFAVGDAGQWTPEPGFSPDLLVSRHGVMFFDNPEAAFRHIGGTAAAGARLVFSCFRSPEGNAWATESARILDIPRPADPYAAGPFAFAEEEHVRAILARSGWRHVTMDPVDYGMIGGIGDDAVDQALLFFTQIGPTAEALKDIADPGKKDAVIQRLRQWIAGFRNADIVSFPAQAWIVSARWND